MKKTRVLYAVLLILIMLSFLGCRSSDSKGTKTEEEKWKTVTSTDKTFEITVPESWKSDNEINKAAGLQLIDEIKGMSAVVIDESKKDLSQSITLKQYSDIVKDTMKQSSQNLVILNEKEVQINGTNSLIFDMEADVKDLKAKYIAVVTEDTSCFYQIICSTVQSRFEQNKDIMMSVVKSFKSNPTNK